MIRYFAACLALLGALVIGTRLPAQQSAAPAAPERALEVATFAAGCFWCTEADFDKVKGVASTISGYMGGHTRSPSYEQVSSGRTGHTEVLQVSYDPRVVSYQQLLDVFWRNVDPLDKDGQFCDRGSQYRPAIFYHSEQQRQLAEDSKAALTRAKRFSQPIVVEVTKAGEFTKAEAYHQDYYKNSPLRYSVYRHGCGRDARLEALWGKAQKQ